MHFSIIRQLRINIYVFCAYIRSWRWRIIYVDNVYTNINICIILTCVNYECIQHKGPVPTRNDDNPVSPNKEALDALLTNHLTGIKIRKSNDNDSNILQNRKPRQRDWIFTTKLITAEKVKWTINTFHPKKSHGMDKILPVLIKETRESITPHLVNIFRAALPSATF